MQLSKIFFRDTNNEAPRQINTSISGMYDFAKLSVRNKSKSKWKVNLGLVTVINKRDVCFTSGYY